MKLDEARDKFKHRTTENKPEAKLKPKFGEDDDYWEPAGCTCFLGRPTCSWCETRPAEYWDSL